MFRKVCKYMTIFGYTRVSTSNQDYQTQIQKLENAGAEKIFSETYTGTKKEGRNELRHLQDAIDKGVTVTFLDNSLTFEPDKKDSMQTLMMNMLGSFAQFERDLIVTRTQEGKQWHKANNKNYREGRPKRVLNDRYKHALELMKTHSMREVVKMTDISLSTLKRIKKQAREEED
ncbi:recombinase family protein [Vagococcus fluvialis]|uniref:recombinase family protein n=1 Tax=Vagococcus fluvialis TaxID=2738 RepID=UPI00288D9539|nr:recombinase family protein [Vagococcus fluvialis]MDT2782645.1 recombinase family protein [Vagococcus fluvialis]